MTGFFSKAARFYQEQRASQTTPLWHEARFQLASLLLGEDHLDRVPPLLESAGAAGDPIAALRENAAGCVLSVLIGRDPSPRFAVAQALADDAALEVPDAQLAMALTAGQPQDIERAVAIRHRVAPDAGECLMSAALLTARRAGAADASADDAAIAFVGLEHGAQVPALALALALAGRDPGGARRRLWQGAARLDRELSTDAGTLRARKTQAPSWSRVASAGQPVRRELRVKLSGAGGAVNVFPYPSLLAIAAPWQLISERCREGDADLLSDGVEIRLVVECVGHVWLAPDAVASIRASIPAGEAWLRALYPRFRSSVTLQIEPSPS